MVMRIVILELLRVYLALERMTGCKLGAICYMNRDHRDEYAVLYESHEKVEELTHILSYFEDNPDFAYWMTMTDTRHLIVSFYNVVLYHLSLQ
ncbi:hypothetical protein ACSBR2_001459 [Camellia fascicularis]